MERGSHKKQDGKYHIYGQNKGAVKLLLLVSVLLVSGFLVFSFFIKGCLFKPKMEQVIVIAIDTLRADHVSEYGYKRPTTPVLDRFAREEASIFLNAYSSSSWTLPSTVSLMTGLHPHQHGVEDRGKKLHPGLPTLAKAYSNAGFMTAAFVTHIYVSSLFGIESGFDSFFELSIDWNFKEGKQLRAAELNQAVFPWLAKHKNKTFFLYLHYFDPHWDYDAPGKFKNRFTRKDYKGPANGTWWFIKKYIPQSKRLQQEDLNHIKGLYDGEIAYTDHHIGQLFDEIKRLGMWTSSTIVILSDHGEEFQDHGSMHHIRTLYEEVLKVPMMIKLQGGRKPGQRPIISERVQTFDIGPTLLELSGVKIPKTFEASSLVPLLRRSGKDRPIFARTRRHESDQVTLIYQDHKMIVPFSKQSRKIELYDINLDPEEKNSVAEQNKGRVQKLGKMIRRLLRRDSRFLKLPGSIGGVKLSQKQIKHLKSLGYIE